MTKQMQQLQKPLTSKEIDFRVQSISKKGYATILAYKDARADMKRLDEVFGVYGWQRDYKQIGSLMLCGVSVWDKDRKQWVTKWDTGTESNTEAQKGLASDSFKRACFNLGIGRELYDYPFICIKLKDNEWTEQGGRGKQTWDLRLKEWDWHTEFVEGELTYIGAKDNHGNLRWSWGDYDKDAARLRAMFKQALSVEKPTDEQSDASDWLNACLKMFEVSQLASTELWSDLNDFDTNKTVMKKTVMDMHAIGGKVFNGCCDQYKLHKENGDDLGMEQTISEVPESLRERLLDVAA